MDIYIAKKKRPEAAITVTYLYSIGTSPVSFTCHQSFTVANLIICLFLLKNLRYFNVYNTNEVCSIKNHIYENLMYLKIFCRKKTYSQNYYSTDKLHVHRAWELAEKVGRQRWRTRGKAAVCSLMNWSIPTGLPAYVVLSNWKAAFENCGLAQPMGWRRV
jgi:hypothetical protein